MLPLLLFAAESVTPKAPTIDPNIAADYWRNRAQIIALKSDLSAKETIEKFLVEKLVTACGKDHQPIDNDGLKCAVKPKEEKEIKK
jgi:hypothetical protein